MGRIFIIEDLDAGKDLYDSGQGILQAALEITNKGELPFFDGHDSDPEEDQKHPTLAKDVAIQLRRLILRINNKPDDYKFSALTKTLAVDFFSEIVDYCEKNPTNRLACYIYT